MKHKTMVIAAHGALGTTISQRLREVDVEVVEQVDSVFSEIEPLYIRNYHELLEPLGGYQKQSKGEKLRIQVLAHIQGKRTIKQELELVNQKVSTLPSAARKYLVEVMALETENL